MKKSIGRMSTLLMAAHMMSGATTNGSMIDGGDIPFVAQPKFTGYKAYPNNHVTHGVGRSQRKRRKLLRSNPHLRRSKKFI